MKLLYVLIILIISFQHPIKSKTTIVFNDLEWKSNCDLFWQENYSSWEQCYDTHIRNKGITFFLASK